MTRRLSAALLCVAALSGACATTGVPPAPTSESSVLEREERAVNLVVAAKKVRSSLNRAAGVAERDGLITAAQALRWERASDALGAVLATAQASLELWLSSGIEDSDMATRATELRVALLQLIALGAELGVKQ